MNLLAWLNLKDIEKNKVSAGKEIAARFARRNVRIQSGEFVSVNEFDARLAEGDAAARRLRERAARRRSAQ